MDFSRVRGIAHCCWEAGAGKNDLKITITRQKIFKQKFVCVRKVHNRFEEVKFSFDKELSEALVRWVDGCLFRNHLYLAPQIYKDTPHGDIQTTKPEPDHLKFMLHTG